MTDDLSATDRSARLNMRISPRALETIRRAATAQQQDVSSFVLGAAMERARAVLVEEQALALAAGEPARPVPSTEGGTPAVPELAALLREVEDLRAQGGRGRLILG